MNANRNDPETPANPLEEFDAELLMNFIIQETAEQNVEMELWDHMAYPALDHGEAERLMPGVAELARAELRNWKMSNRLRKLLTQEIETLARNVAEKVPLHQRQALGKAAAQGLSEAGFTK